MGTRHGKAEDTVTADDDQHLDRDVTQRFSVVYKGCGNMHWFGV